MGRVADIIALTGNILRFGKGGPKLKANSGVMEVRNNADDAMAAIRASLFATFGNDFELNAGATEAGADWKMTLRRPSTGMTHNLIVVMPSGDPSPGQALTVASFDTDTITLQWTTVAGGTDKVVTDTTTFEAGDSSPIAMFTLPANAVVKRIAVVMDESFNGTAPQLSVGISGTTSKYLSSAAVDLQDPAATVTEVDPGLPAEAGTEALIATLNSDGADEGAGRILVDYVIPS